MTIFRSSPKSVSRGSSTRSMSQSTRRMCSRPTCPAPPASRLVLLKTLLSRSIHPCEPRTMQDVFMDEREDKVRLLRVAAGGFLGLRETKFLIPFDAVTATVRSWGRRECSTGKRRSIFTIGHSARRIDACLALLGGNGSGHRHPDDLPFAPQPAVWPMMAFSGCSSWRRRAGGWQ
jgi:PRC-barrel domain protein